MIELKGIEIGESSIKGSLKETSDGYSLTAGGLDIWEKNDQGYFAYTEQDADFDFSVRITSLTMADLYTKAGIMARESAADNSRLVYHLIFGTNAARNKNNGGYEFQYRAQTDGDSAAIYPSRFDTAEPEFPVNFPDTWLRLQRTGDEYIAFYSRDGKGWKEYCRTTIELNKKLMVGVCVTAHSANESVECTFTDVAV